MSVRAVRQVYLVGVAFCYAVAFGSLYAQLPGLYYTKGILPVVGFLRRIRDNAQLASATPLERIQAFPSLIWLHKSLGLHVDHMLDFLALSGVLLAIAAMLTWRVRTRVVFAALWALYFSLYQVGQTFMHFQWDILLLEAGFLAIVASPSVAWLSSTTRPNGTVKRLVKTDDNPATAMMLVRWLFFRLMFLSGIVKLTSRCPTWWGLTAMNFHYESQCLPTPLAWYAHLLPPWFQSLSVVGVYLIEGLCPFLFFVPSRQVRLLAGGAQVFLMILIMLTGNYNFFNILTCVLSVSVMTDADLIDLFPEVVQAHTNDRDFTLSDWFTRHDVFAVAAVLVAAAGVMTTYFGLSLSLNTGVTANIMFTPARFAAFVTNAMVLGMILGGIYLLAAICTDFINARNYKLPSTLITTALAVVIFAASLETLRHNDENSSLQRLPGWTYAQQAENLLRPYSITNSYGLFRRMTGVEARPEISIEGSIDNKKWFEYNFRYKPDDVEEAPRFVIPHQPRLDWQMWFAALQRVENNPWLQNLAICLLEGQREVMALLNIDSKHKFYRLPPVYLRMILWDYHFTNVTHGGPKQWWYRRAKSEYLKPISLATHEEPIKEFRKQIYGGNVAAAPEPEKCTRYWLCHIMAEFRKLTSPYYDSLPAVLSAFALFGLISLRWSI